MPLSRSWVEQEIEGLTGEDFHTAKLILVVCKASYQFDDSLIKGVMGDIIDEQRLIRILSFAAMLAARRLADHVARRLKALNSTVPTNEELPPVASSAQAVLN